MMHQIYFNFKSFDKKCLVRNSSEILSVFKFLKLNSVTHQTHPKKEKKITILRSPHVDKKSREQFQRSTYKKTLAIQLSNISVVVLVFEILKDLKFKGSQLEVLINYSGF